MMYKKSGMFCIRGILCIAVLLLSACPNQMNVRDAETPSEIDMPVMNLVEKKAGETANYTFSVIAGDNLSTTTTTIAGIADTDIVYTHRVGDDDADTLAIHLAEAINKAKGLRYYAIVDASTITLEALNELSGLSEPISPWIISSGETTVFSNISTSRYLQDSYLVVVNRLPPDDGAIKVESLNTNEEVNSTVFAEADRLKGFSLSSEKALAAIKVASLLSSEQAKNGIVSGPNSMSIVFRGDAIHARGVMLTAMEYSVIELAIAEKNAELQKEVEEKKETKDDTLKGIIEDFINPHKETPAPAEEPGEIPGTETPGTETPGTETPGTETPGTETPGAETPGTETPGTETLGDSTQLIEVTGISGWGQTDAKYVVESSEFLPGERKAIILPSEKTPVDNSDFYTIRYGTPVNQLPDGSIDENIESAMYSDLKTLNINLLAEDSQVSHGSIVIVPWTFTYLADDDKIYGTIEVTIVNNVDN
ncbi:MAG: hypothetical protein LBM77_01710 [Spirochaetaceae bacterium]|jgi:hypothetical protein|nr:hypothetical protein [Spirochaetaceae bacterium]